MSPVFLFTALSVCCCWAWSRLRMSESNSDYRAWPWHLRVTLLFFTLALKPQLFFFFIVMLLITPCWPLMLTPSQIHFGSELTISSVHTRRRVVWMKCPPVETWDQTWFHSFLVSVLNTSTTCQWRTFIESYGRDVVPEGLRERKIDILTLIAT